MQKFINNISFWFNSARGYSIPTSLMSWSVPFIFGLTDGGNIFYGLLALLGILAVHLGVNLFDDVIDYYLEKKRIDKGLCTTFNLQKGKCQYILDGRASLVQTLLVALGLFSFASILGIFLTLACGKPVVVLIFATAVLCLLYPVLTYYALGEVIVGTIFAPMLYFGTYFVMTKSFSLEIMIISISTGLLTIGLLHTNTFMDYDCDSKNNKKTLCALVGTKKNAVIAQGVIMLLAYLNLIITVIIGYLPTIMLLSLLTIPTSVSLCKLMTLHIKNPEIIVPRTFWMGPMENWDNIVKNNLESFMIKFLLARNVMLIFTIFICIAKIISEFIGHN